MSVLCSNPPLLPSSQSRSPNHPSPDSCNLLATWPHVLQPTHTFLLALSGTPCSLFCAKFFLSNQAFEWGICEYVCPPDFLSCFSSRWPRSLLPRSVYAGPAHCLLHCRLQLISCWMYIKQAYNVCSHVSHWWKCQAVADSCQQTLPFWVMSGPSSTPSGSFNLPTPSPHTFMQSVHLRTSRSCSPGTMRAQQGLLNSLQQVSARSFALPHQEYFLKRKWV